VCKVHSGGTYTLTIHRQKENEQGKTNRSTTKHLDLSFNTMDEKEKKQNESITREEISQIIQGYLSNLDIRMIPHNKISIADVEVESNTESLKTCKQIANEVIQTNRDFIAERKNKLNREQLGYTD
jgi:DNA-binding XRE family transcriptional regulator